MHGVISIPDATSCDKDYYYIQVIFNPFYSGGLSHTDKNNKNGIDYSKTCLMRHLKTDKTKVLMQYGSLLKVESIAECSCKGTVLQYF